MLAPVVPSRDGQHSLTWPPRDDMQQIWQWITGKRPTGHMQAAVRSGWEVARADGQRLTAATHATLPTGWFTLCIASICCGFGNSVVQQTLFADDGDEHDQDLCRGGVVTTLRSCANSAKPTTERNCFGAWRGHREPAACALPFTVNWSRAVSHCLWLIAVSSRQGLGAVSRSR